METPRPTLTEIPEPTDTPLPTDTPYPEFIKWEQPPGLNPTSPYPDCFWGWDEPSVFGGRQIVADDWPCNDPRPITDIHWWGSYVNWEGTEPPLHAPQRFHIGIWTDVPADPTTGEPSHPGELIQAYSVVRELLNERWVGCDFYPERPMDTCFRYDLYLPREAWFYQEPDKNRIYWISIAAIYAAGQSPEYPWGWKTRERVFMDDAVVITVPTDPSVGDSFQEGFPIEDPPGFSWDWQTWAHRIGAELLCGLILRPRGPRYAGQPLTHRVL